MGGTRLPLLSPLPARTHEERNHQTQEEEEEEEEKKKKKKRKKGGGGDTEAGKAVEVAGADGETAVVRLRDVALLVQIHGGGDT